MVDYADGIVKENAEVKESTRDSAVSVEMPVIQLSFALLVAVLIYVLGYQNSTIEQVQHSINVKRTKLIELKMQMDTLRVNQAKIFNSNSVVADCESKNMKVAKNIQIVY